jgi:hypothetical protein
MSRSGYSDDGDGESYSLAMWRGTIASATRGKRGQRFFRDLVAALDEMPVKRLIAKELQTEEGEVCALGSLGRARGIPLGTIDVEDMADSGDYGYLGRMFDIASQLSQEVMYINDEAGPVRYERVIGYPSRRAEETPEERWTRMRAWAARQIRPTEDELLPDPDAAATSPLLEKLPAETPVKGQRDEP